MNDKMFNTIEELMAYMQKEIPLSLEVIGKEVRDILIHNVQQLWYDRPDYKYHYYDRTMEYINSIECSKVIYMGGGMYEVEVSFNTDLIHPYASENGNWPQHESIYGEDVSEAIPYYIESGNNSPLYSYKGVHPVETTKQWLEDASYLQARIIELLGTYGITCSVI